MSTEPRLRQEIDDLLNLLGSTDDVSGVASDFEALITKRTLEAKRDLLDSIIDLNGETFNKWTQNDIANFFHGVGKIYRDLEAELKKGLDTNHE